MEQSEECVCEYNRYGAVLHHASAPLHSPGAVFVQDALQRAHQLLRVDRFLGAEAVHLLVEVRKLHPSLSEVAQLLG